MEAIIALVYFLGIPTSIGVFRVRAGINFMGGVLLGFQNFGWSVLSAGKSLVWPIVLIVWLVTGAKPSPWRIQDGKVIRQERTAQPG